MPRVVVLIILACFWAACWAYQTGAPESVCASMTPGHPTSDTPSLRQYYNITISKNQYSPGEKITVTITGNSGTTFLGFLVQVRQGTTAVGTMAPLGGQTICNQAAATHMSRAVKSTMSIVWTAPAGNTGDVQVWATIVLSLPVWTTMVGPTITFFPYPVSAAGLTVDTTFIIRNSIFGFRSQIAMFSLLMMKMLF